MSITRIQNNQITDSTIVAYAKIQNGSLTGNLFAPNVTLNSNVTINGGLFLGNTGNTLIINATNTFINDPIVTFNNGYVGSLTGYDIGMLVNRNLSSLASYGSVNTAWVWSEADGAFVAIATTDTGIGSASINNSGFANVKIGNSVVTGAQTIGSTFSVAGATTLNTVTGASFQGVIGNVSAAAGTFTTGTFNTSATVNGTLVATTVNAVTIGNVNANIVGSGTYLTNLSGSAITGTASTANVSLYEQVSASTTNATFYPTIVDKATGNVIAYTNSSLTYNPSTGALSATSLSGTLNATNVSGTVATANVAYYEVLTNSTTNATFYPSFFDKATGNASAYTNTALNFNPSTGTLAASAFSGGTGSFTTLGATGIVSFTNSTNNTGSGTGALRVTGGAWIGGNLWIDGNLNLATSTTVTSPSGVFTGNAAGFGALYAGINSGYVFQAQTVLQASTNFNGYAQVNHQNINGGSLASGDYIVTANNGTANDTYIDMGMASSTYNYPGFGLLRPNDGYLLVYGNTTTKGGNLVLGVGGGGLDNDIIFAVGGFDSTNEYGRIDGTGNIFVIKSAVAATNEYSGAITVAGGVGIAGALYTGGIGKHGAGLQNTPIGNATPSTAAFTTVTASGITQITNATAATNNATGALQVTGGASIGGNLWVGGNVYAGNIIGTTQSVITVQDPLLYLQANTPSGTYSYDIGFYSDYTAPIYAHTGLARNFNTNVWTFFSNISSEPTATGINWSDAGIAFDSVKAGALLLANSTAASSTTSGALQVVGGAGIQGAVYAGSLFDSGNRVLTSLSSSGAGNVSVTISAPGSSTVALTATGPGAVTTGSSTGIPVITTDAYGRIASISTVAPAGSAVTGTVATANVALYEQLTNSTTNATFYPSFFDKATGNALAYTNTTLNFNPSTGTLAATAFTGALTGSLTGTATTSNVSLYDVVTSTSTAGTYYPAFFDKTSGNGSNYVSSSLSYNPSTGALSATSFNGVGTFSTATTSSTLIASGNIVAAATTVTNDNNTGSLVAKGGIAAVGNINVGGQMFVGASAQATVLTSAIAVKRGTSTSGPGVQFTQDALINATNTGSSDFIAYGNNYPGPSNDHGWMDLGFTGDAFSDPVYSITKSNDGYLFASGANTTVGGNLVLSTDYTGGYNDVVIGVGSFYANSEVARFHGNSSNSGTFVLKLNTPNTTAANTGAFQVWGGASFSGNVYHGGGATFNGSQTSNYDFKVAGVNSTNLLWARPNSTYDTVVVGNTLVAGSIVNGAKLQINSTDSMLLPVGTSAQRPGSVGFTDVAGMFRYNTTTNAIEYYGGSTPGWQSVTSQFTVISDQQFTGTGSTAVFTLSSSQTTASCIVSINGVVQIPTLAYSVSGTTLTFTENPANGDVIDVRMLTTTATVTNLTSLNGYNAFAVDNSGTYVYTGTASQNLQYTFEPVNGAMVTNGANVTVASAGTSVVDNLFANTYSSAKYTITATLQGTSIREIVEILMIHNGSAAGAGTATISAYNRVNTAGNTLVTWGATTSGNIAQLQATTTNANTILRIKRDYQAI